MTVLCQWYLATPVCTGSVFVCRVLGLEREWMTKNNFMLTYTENT